MSAQSISTRGGMPRARQLLTRWRYHGFSVMPSSSANAVLPPAESMSFADSSGVIDTESTHEVYRLQSQCGPSIYTVRVRLTGMGDETVFDRVIRLAWERRKWKRADLIREFDVRKQDLTNWKRRGVPAARHAEIARKLGCSIEEFLYGDSVKKPLGSRSAPVLLVTRADLDALPDGEREMTNQLIETIRKAVSNVAKKQRSKPIPKSA